MKRTSIFSRALALILVCVLCIGVLPTMALAAAGDFATSSNIVTAAGTNAYLTDKININGNQYSAYKIGTSKAGGDMSVTIPAGATGIAFYAVSWSSATTTVTVKGFESGDETFNATAAGISGNSPYTYDSAAGGEPSTHLLQFTFGELTEAKTITLSASARVVFFGINEIASATPSEPEPTTPPTEPAQPTEPATESNFVLTDISEIGAEDKVVVTMQNASGVYALSNNNGASAAPSAVQVNVSENDKLVGEIPGTLVWNVQKGENGTLTFLVAGDNSSWLYATETNNGVRVGTNTNKTFTIEDGYLKHLGTSRYLGVYNGQDWRCYTSINTNITGQTLAFYVEKAPAPADTDAATTVELALSDSILLNFHFHLTAETAANANAAVKFFEGDELLATVPVSEATVAGDEYLFGYALTSVEMDKQITAALYIGDEAQEATKTTSINAMADAYISAYAGTNVAEAAEALKLYGAAAKLYLLGEDTLTEADRAYLADLSVSTNVTYSKEGSAKEHLKSASLALNSKTGMRFYFDTDITGWDVTVRVNGVGKNDHTIVKAVSGSRWYLEITDLKASELDSAITLIVSNGEDSVTVNYGAMLYCARMTADGKSEATQLMAKALFNYANAVKF